MTALSSASADRLRGVLRTDVSMASHVSWRCGGRARRTYQPADLADLCNFLRTLPSNEPLCFVGLGSNLLLRDGGWLGTVILMHRSSAAIRLEGEQFWADAGAACPKLARHAARESFEGAEFLAGVPAFVVADTAPIVDYARRLARTQGAGKVTFGTEAGLFTQAGIPTVVLGPGSIDDAHRPDEFVSLEQMAACDAFMRRIIESRLEGVR